LGSSFVSSTSLFPLFLSTQSIRGCQKMKIWKTTPTSAIRNLQAYADIDT
jgi:hypothetical protein